jgi:outer membrane receptor for ferrienterochelin and colicins
MNSRMWVSAVVAAAMLTWPLPLAAQDMDYTALEKTFGESVTTSATGVPQRATDAPVDMIIISAEDIRRSGAHDIPGVLRHVPGVDVLQWTNDDADVSVRGYDQPYSPRLLVLIDGRQVYADYYGFTPWSALPVELNAIRQIEIVKGPNAALFGFNAVGGVINIVTYNPLYDDINTGSLAGGTQGLTEGTGVATLRDGNMAALRISAGGRIDDDFSTPIPAAIAGPPRENDYRGEIDLDGVTRLSDKIQLGLEASHSLAAQNEIFPGLSLETGTIYTDSIKGQLAADTNAGLIHVTAYTNWIEQHADFSISGQPQVYTLANQVTVAQAEDIIALDADNTVRLAGEYRYTSSGTTPITGAAIFYDVVSGSAAWTWQILPTLSLANAGRIDNMNLGRSGYTPPFFPFENADWNRELSEFSYNSGLVWHPGESDTLRAIASRGVQLPSLVEFGAILSENPRSFSETGNPNLDPTIVSNYELGWDHDFAGIPAKLRASVFHQDTSDIVSVGGNYLLTPGGVWSTPANVGDSQADGFELIGSGNLDRGWRWSVGYRYEAVHDDFAPFAQNGADFVDYEHSTPHHLIKLNLGWSDDRWELDGFLDYQSQTFGLVQGTLSPATTEERIPDYASIDARAAYRVNDNMSVAVSAQNIVPSRQQQTTGPDIERRVLFTVTVNH